MTKKEVLTCVVSSIDSDAGTIVIEFNNDEGDSFDLEFLLDDVPEDFQNLHDKFKCVITHYDDGKTQVDFDYPDIDLEELGTIIEEIKKHKRE